MTVWPGLPSIEDDPTFEDRWARLEQWIGRRFRQKSGIEALLFLIGIQESGTGHQPELEKEAKQDLIMLGTCYAFEAIGVYRQATNERGEVVWQKTVDPLPIMTVEEQENLLKLAILTYFEARVDLTPTGDSN